MLGNINADISAGANTYKATQRIKDLKKGEVRKSVKGA